MAGSSRPKLLNVSGDTESTMRRRRLPNCGSCKTLNMEGIFSVVLVECESVPTADSGCGKDITTGVVNLQTLSKWLFFHTDDTLHYNNGKYFGGD